MSDENEDKKPITQTAPTRKGSRVRFPVQMWIKHIIFEPDTTGEPTDSAWDVELDEQDMQFMFDELGKRLKDKQIKATRVRFIGSQNSQ